MRKELQIDRTTYPILDLLRFFAATLVVLLHLVGSNDGSNLWVNFLSPGTTIRHYYPNINQIVFMGFIGVQIFFSISGYIIFISAERSKSPIDFFERRLLRILPALWISAVCGAAVFVIFHVYPLRDIFSMLAKSVLIMPFGPYVDNVIWTIIVEMAFYIGVAFSLLLMSKSKLIYFGYALIAASTLYWMSMILFPVLADNKIFLQLSRRLLLEHGAFFGIGMLLAPRSGVVGQKNIKRFFILLALVPIYLQIRDSTLYVYKDSAVHGASPDAWKPFAIYMIALAMIYLSTLLAEGKYLRGNFAAIRKIGVMTYPIYLLHFTFGNFFYGLLESHTDFPRYLNTAISIAGVLLLSYVVAEHVEGRVRNILKPLLSWLFTHVLVLLKFADQKIGGAKLRNAE